MAVLCSSSIMRDACSQSHKKRSQFLRWLGERKHNSLSLYRLSSCTLLPCERRRKTVLRREAVLLHKDVLIIATPPLFSRVQGIQANTIVWHLIFPLFPVVDIFWKTHCTTNTTSTPAAIEAILCQSSSDHWTLQSHVVHTKPFVEVHTSEYHSVQLLAMLAWNAML